MKLKARNLNWQAGRPVVILSKEVARKLNIHVNERVSLSLDHKKYFAVVDIYSGPLKKGEIGLSNEISTLLNISNHSFLEVAVADSLATGEIIKKKFEGNELSPEEINTIIKDISNNNLTEQEVAFFLSAEKVIGMSQAEIVSVIRSMVSMGKTIDFGGEVIADKHCIGGIAGNRTTPIVVAICAAAGLKIPKSSSRAITSASGTADVIETLANVELSAEEIKKIVNKIGGCLVWGGALGLAPSDDKIIHVERTLNLDVEPQLIASILAKKIAAGSNRILIDIPFGGGKIKSKYQAKQLGKKFEAISKKFNLKLEAVYTDGKQPIGNGFGPVLEMIDIISIFKNKPHCAQDLKEKSLFLASRILKLCDIKNPEKIATEILSSGKAYEKFKQIINAQNKSNDFDKRLSSLKLAKYTQTLHATSDGKITQIHNKLINSVCRILGTPETKTAGLYLHKHLGKIKKGEKILTVYSESEARLQEAMEFIEAARPVVIK